MKTLLYDKLVNGEMIAEQDKTFLVDFKQKVKSTNDAPAKKNEKKTQEDTISDSELNKYDSEGDDDWYV